MKSIAATDYIRSIIMPAALGMLPPKMDSPEARAMVIAPGLQESRFIYRKQVDGPARGFWQFERMGGVRGVLAHPASRPHIEAVLEKLGYDNTTATSYEAIAHNDVLACVFARLLLWTSPLPLPKRADAHGGWLYYINCWRPGKPHPGTWDAFFAQAWSLAEVER